MFRNRSVLYHTLISLVLSQIIFMVVFYFFPQLPPLVPIWYLQIWGEAQLSPRQMLWVLPGTSIAILIVNLIWVKLIHRRQPFLINLVLMTNTIFQIYLLLAVFQILNRVL